MKTIQNLNNIQMELVAKNKVVKIEEGKYRYKSKKSFIFENGKSIPELELQFETYGELNHDKSNVILIHHSLSVGADALIWWHDFIGQNKIIDTSKYYIICINNLGSCFGSVGPSLNSINPETNKPYLRDFPEFSFVDIVNSQLDLLDYLDINKLYAVIGSSMGGMISLTLLQERPEIIERLFLCATAYKPYPFNIANRMVQKEVIENDQNYNNGFYNLNPKEGLKIARKIGYLFYRGIPELNKKFSNLNSSNSEIYNYYEYNAEKFSNIFDANSYIYTLNCMDNYNINFEKMINYQNKNITKNLNNFLKIFILGIDSDILFPLYQQEELYLELNKIFNNIKLIKHESLKGHDSFFVESESYVKYFQDFFK